MTSDRVFFGRSLTIAGLVAGACFAAAVAVTSPARPDRVYAAPANAIQLAAISTVAGSAQ